MKDLLCLVHVSQKVGKEGMPFKCSYSYRYNKCKCDNCRAYKKQTAKEFFANNKDKIIKHKQEYYQKNKKQIRERQLVYEAKTKDKRKEYLRQYHQENKHLSREAWRRREALKKGNGFEYYTEKQVLETYGTTCYLCNEPIDMQAPRLVGKQGWKNGLHIEHVVDLALGGPDTLQNVRPAHALCNLKKKPRAMV
jgi:hypothetical protein